MSSSVVKRSRENNILKPFLRWAGGKQLIVKDLLIHIPNSINIYHEPFLGAGSLFFANGFESAYLSDINSNLINCYKYLQAQPEELYNKIKDLKSQHSKEFYYYVRRLFNKQMGQYFQPVARRMHRL